MLREASERGWRLTEFMMLEAARPMGLELAGAITTLLPDDPLVEKLRSWGCPTVRLGRIEHPDDGEIPAVLADFVELGRLAAEHFIVRGFRNLALVGHELYRPLQHMQAGMVALGNASNCTCSVLAYPNIGSTTPNVPFGSGKSGREKAIQHWLGSLPKPVGILTSESWLTGNIALLCQDAGLKIPEQVALLSANNLVALCELSLVPISAVDFPLGDRARTAMRLLGEMMLGNRPPPRTYIKPKGIITRRSTDILAVDNIVVAQAIRFMWDHLAIDLSVDDVALGVGTPRHTLQRLFRKHLNCGVHEEMRRARLEMFARLLRSTDDTIEQLAPRVGFKTAAYVTLAFRETYGLTPKQYRLQHRQGYAQA
jgi:LacI family transcriptional regulator